MAVRKLYGNPGCRATMRVLASMFEHELEFEFILIDLKTDDHKKEPSLSLSPFGEIPVFEEESLTLIESRAVMRYISHQYPKQGNEQVYELPKLQGIAAAWIDVEDHEFEPASSKLVEELVYKPNNGLPVDRLVVADKEAELGIVLDVYEERLRGSKYLGGDKFTSADLTHLPNLYYLMRTPVKRLFHQRPHVSAWCTDILARPSWTRVVEMAEKNMA